MGGSKDEIIDLKDSDEQYLLNSCISFMPLQYDMTNYSYFKDIDCSLNKPCLDLPNFIKQVKVSFFYEN